MSGHHDCPTFIAVNADKLENCLTTLTLSIQSLKAHSPLIQVWIRGGDSWGIPANGTGIVLCDLIDCANTFKEIITMPARSLCQKSFKNILEPLHLYRRQSLIEATSVVINGASLTLIQYWAWFVRSSIGQAQDKTYRSTSGKVSLAEWSFRYFFSVLLKITEGMTRVVMLSYMPACFPPKVTKFGSPDNRWCS